MLSSPSPIIGPDLTGLNYSKFSHLLYYQKTKNRESPALPYRNRPYTPTTSRFLLPLPHLPNTRIHGKIQLPASPHLPLSKVLEDKRKKPAQTSLLFLPVPYCDTAGKEG